MECFRRNILEMEGYLPGEQPGEGYIKLNTNENPYPPPKVVLEAIKNAVNENLRLYPPPCADELREAAAEAYDFPPECIMPGNGSDELLNIAIRTFVGEGEHLVYPWPSYVLYRTLAKIQNASPIEVRFPADFSFPQELMNVPAKLILFCNPNSPSGTMVPSSTLEMLAKNTDGCLLIDEAYADFADDNCLHLARTLDNVIVLRTFSKSFSLAGLRVGLAFASSRIIREMSKVKDSYNMDRLAIAGAAAALRHMNYMHANVTLVKQERERLSRKLREMGFTVFPSQANFLLVRPPQRITARELYEGLKESKILVRFFDVDELRAFVRITVGTREETNALVRGIHRVLAQR